MADDKQEAETKALDGINKLVAEYVAQSFTDLDLAAESADFRRGYEAGFREAMAAGILLKLKA